MIYTRRFFHHYAELAGSVIVWQPSGDFTWILRDLVMANNGVTAARVSVWLTTGEPGALILLSVPDLAGETTTHLELRQEILSGEVVYAYSEASAWSVLGTGYRFVGAAPRADVLPAA